MRLHVEMKDSEVELRLPNDGGDLAAFLSFANLRGFGATHPLIALADRLHDKHHVAMGPLTIFYGRDVEDDEDAEKLEKAWQPAGPLADSLDSVCTAFETDVQVLALARRADAGGLHPHPAGAVGQDRDRAADPHRRRPYHLWSGRAHDVPAQHRLECVPPPSGNALSGSTARRCGWSGTGHS